MKKKTKKKQKKNPGLMNHYKNSVSYNASGNGKGCLSLMAKGIPTFFQGENLFILQPIKSN